MKPSSEATFTKDWVLSISPDLESRWDHALRCHGGEGRIQKISRDGDKRYFLRDAICERRERLGLLEVTLPWAEDLNRALGTRIRQTEIAELIPVKKDPETILVNVSPLILAQVRNFSGIRCTQDHICLGASTYAFTKDGIHIRFEALGIDANGIQRPYHLQILATDIIRICTPRTQRVWEPTLTVTPDCDTQEQDALLECEKSPFTPPDHVLLTSLQRRLAKGKNH